MKIRVGFVSNSSSSSFCIYGMYLDENARETLKKAMDMEDIDSWDFDKKAEVMGLTIKMRNGPSEYDEDSKYCIGRSWSTIKDDETGKAFKNSIHSDLAQLGITPTCRTIEESWYNG